MHIFVLHEFLYMHIYCPNGTRVCFALTILPCTFTSLVACMAWKQIIPRQWLQCQGKVREQSHAFSGMVCNTHGFHPYLIFEPPSTVCYGFFDVFHDPHFHIFFPPAKAVISSSFDTLELTESNQRVFQGIIK